MSDDRKSLFVKFSPSHQLCSVFQCTLSRCGPAVGPRDLKNNTSTLSNKPPSNATSLLINGLLYDYKRHQPPPYISRGAPLTFPPLFPQNKYSLPYLCLIATIPLAPPLTMSQQQRRPHAPASVPTRGQPTRGGHDKENDQCETFSTPLSPFV